MTNIKYNASLEQKIKAATEGITDAHNNIYNNQYIFRSYLWWVYQDAYNSITSQPR